MEVGHLSTGVGVAVVVVVVVRASGGGGSPGIGVVVRDRDEQLTIPLPISHWTRRLLVAHHRLASPRLASISLPPSLFQTLNRSAEANTNGREMKW